jgi:hypothetical protein
MDKRKIEEL